MSLKFFRHAYRTLLFNKFTTVLNLAGLSIAIAVSLLIYSWISGELSFEDQNLNKNEIYRVNKKYRIGDKFDYNSSTPFPLYTYAKNSVPGVKDAGAFVRRPTALRFGDKNFREKNVFYSTSSILNIFTINFISSPPEEVFESPDNILISKKTAKKYFGEKDPLGEMITVNNRRQVKVAGIFEDIQDNTDFQFEVLLPVKIMTEPADLDNWYSHWLNTFILTDKGADAGAIEETISKKLLESLEGQQTSASLQQLSKIHLYSESGKPEGMRYLFIFGGIGIFVLLIACINYINLSTAQSLKRAKEVMIRKISGAVRGQLVWQLIAETMLLVILATIAGIALSEFVRPWFNEMTGVKTSTNLLDSNTVIPLIILVLTIGGISSLVPAVVNSSFNPASVMRGEMHKGQKGAYLRKALVTFQFILTVIMLVGALTIYNQISYMKNKNLGYKKENLIYIRTTPEIVGGFDTWKHRLKENSGITDVCLTSDVPSEAWSIMRGITWEGKRNEEGTTFGFIAVDYNYLEMMGIEIVEGRGFDKEYGRDYLNYIINSKALSLFEGKNPIGINLGVIDEEEGEIIGITNDFHFLPLNYEIEPLVMLIAPDFYRYTLIKYQGEDVESIITKLEEVYNELTPGTPFDYGFLDQVFESTYKTEITSGKISAFIVLLAIIISCLGLLGLTSFIVEKRTREIGIRKTLGASSVRIISLLTAEYAGIVALSNVIAWPIAYYLTNNWLEGFVYRTEPDIFVFLAAGGIAFTVAITTILVKTVRAALANPVDSLRYE